MKECTTKQREKVKSENELFPQDKHLFPCPKKTFHCQPFWYIHPTKELLKKGVKSKLNEFMTPKYLQMTCLEYKEFDLRTFGKHVYAEAAKQLNKAYWQLWRSKTAMKVYREQTKKQAKLRTEKRKDVVGLFTKWKYCNNDTIDYVHF